MLPPHSPSQNQTGGPPKLRPSYTVHVTVTSPRQVGTTGTEGPTWFTSSGFRLQDLLSTLYGMPAERIEFDQPGLADRRLTVTLRLPAKEGPDSMHQRIVKGLESRLGMEIRSLTRIEDVYTITVADPKKLPLHKAPSRGFITSTVTELAVDASDFKSKDQGALARLTQQRLEGKRRRDGIALDSIDMDGDVDDLCRILETDLQRPVLDRTGYRGPLSISIRRAGVDRERFFDRIKADYGLSITPERAAVQHLIVRAEATRRSSH